MSLIYLKWLAQITFLFPFKNLQGQVEFLGFLKKEYTIFPDCQHSD